MQLLSPLENEAKFSLNWIQVRPRLSQKFGGDFKHNGNWFYKEMGLIGHNGIDFGVKMNTPIFASIDGFAKAKNDEKEGYGLHVKIRNPHLAIEIVVAHLKKVKFHGKTKVDLGEIVGESGNSGASLSPHLHFGLRFLQNSSKDIWKWKVKNYKNGYFGYVNPLDTLITWKGGLFKTTLA